METSGIYQIRNLVNNHIYIGSAIKLLSRKSKHFSGLNRNKHENDHLQKAYNLYGAESFIFEPLMICSPETLIQNEQLFIDQLKPEYNINPTAGNRLGSKASAETIEKLKKSHIGKAPSKETILKMLESRKRNGLSEEARLKLSLAGKGKVRTKENKERIALTLMGHPVSQETKDKISNSKKGKENIHKRKPLEHTLISPSGEIYEVLDRKEFCREHGLLLTSLCAIDKGRNLSHKGWKIIEKTE